MAFSMKQIKTEKKSNDKFDTNVLFAWLGRQDNISNSVKYIISAYTRKRLGTFGKGGLSEEIYKYMVKDLLKNCCGKEFIELTVEDTADAFNDVIYQLKWAFNRHQKDKRTLYKHTIYQAKNSSYISDTEPDYPNFAVTQVNVDNYFGGELW